MTRSLGRRQFSSAPGRERWMPGMSAEDDRVAGRGHCLGGDMASIFTKIIRGELPARFVWKDEQCVAFLSVNPLKSGHTLVVPRMEVDHWLDLDPGLMKHLTDVAQI